MLQKTTSGTLRVHVTATSLKRQLTENPFFPSLYALSSVFNRFQIPHHAFKLDIKNLDDLTPPLINGKEDAEQIHQTLDNWHLPEKKSYSVFAAKYPLNEEIKGPEWQVDAMRKWCDEAGITHTPTIFINGKRLPEKYIPIAIGRRIEIYIIKIFFARKSGKRIVYLHKNTILFF